MLKAGSGVSDWTEDGLEFILKTIQFQSLDRDYRLHAMRHNPRMARLGTGGYQGYLA